MLDTALGRIRIILVEPAGPLNVGSVARAMKNMGLHHLVLVNPQCDRLGEEARKMAVHAADVLESAKIVKTLPEALQGCQRAIATTGQNRSLPTTLENPKSALPWLLECSSALIFGREDNGLTNAELSYAQRLIRIPSSDTYASLNLAQAVAICCYELYQVAGEMGSGGDGEMGNGEVEENSQLPITHYPLPITNYQLSITTQAPLEALEGYYQQLEASLLKIGYIYPHTAASRMEKFRRLFNRAYPSTAEVAMLRGILRQIDWALQTYPKSAVNDTLDASPPDCSKD
ncbi:RNA methyltransferase [Kamptonema sp. UHCC 0994]|uniref:RNA methyltransferase n=1 Tax=Kamptonema sp. UHCC 0994 TaxID=3031329 RepID=UPI0023B8DD98|nr:RNA methyltransferase [Kamptonema sp. UHCC 0994]MDF0552658.1 RNA methyltransferase [Kamptonema sp. UHCC 0994]